MKRLIVILSLFLSMASMGQTWSGERITARSGIYLSDWWITRFQRDTAFSSHSYLPTSQAVKEFVDGRIKSIPTGPAGFFVDTMWRNNDSLYYRINGFSFNLGRFAPWANYLTSESDPMVGSHIKAITSGDISNWSTAYSWGNHAGLYPLMSGSYTNPAWITSLDWLKITGAPSFLTSESDPSAIKNQYALAQNAKHWTSDSTRFSGPVRLDSTVIFVKPIRLPSFATAPTTVADGDMYYFTVNNRPYVRTGGADKKVLLEGDAVSSAPTGQVLYGNSTGTGFSTDATFYADIANQRVGLPVYSEFGPVTAGDRTASPTSMIARTARFVVTDGTILMRMGVGTNGYIGTNSNHSLNLQVNGITVAALGTSRNVVFSANGSTTELGRVTVNGTTASNGSQRFLRSIVATNYTIQNTDYFIGVTAVPITLTLPAASVLGTSANPYEVEIKDETGSASVANPITIVGTVEGVLNPTITTPYGKMIIYSTGTNYLIK